MTDWYSAPSEQLYIRDPDGIRLQIAAADCCSRRMYKLNGIMRQGTIDSSLTSVRYATLEEARAGARELLRDDRVLRAMIVWDEIPPRFAEWVER